jgi:predicted transcriptional regulator
MNIKAKKLELVQLILDIEKPSILDKISKMLKREKELDWADSIGDNLRTELEASMSAADNGDVISHQEAMKQVKSRYNI